MYEAGGLLFIYSFPIYCLLFIAGFLITCPSPNKKGFWHRFFDLLTWRVLIRLIMINYLPVLIASGFGRALRTTENLS